MVRKSQGFSYFLAISVVATLVSGCATQAAINPVGPPTAASQDASKDLPNVNEIDQAGVEPKLQPVPKMLLASAAAAKYGPARPDPFALKASERQYDVDQEGERVFGDIGGFQNQFTPSNPFPTAIPPAPMAQPYRRLSGIVVGDSVVALITMENGNSYIIHPGQQLPDPYSEWTVKSIDMDQAVLVRKNGNPSEVTIRLELPPNGGTMMPGAGGPPTMGGGPPGVPGGPPGRRRGGMGAPGVG